MRLHFADNGDDRGQYGLLVLEGVRATLVSYHYLRKPYPARYFADLWTAQAGLHLMNLHLSNTATHTPASAAIAAEGVRNVLVSHAYPAIWEEYVEAWGRVMHLHFASTHGGPLNGDSLSAEDIESTLLSYAYRNVEPQFHKPWERPDLRPRVIIDSGAFTAWASGRPIKPPDYLAWAEDFRARWADKMASLAFINLDVIGDQAQTDRNQAWFEDRGFRPVPVLTTGAPIAELDRLMAAYDYICIGGLVPLAQQRKKMQGWLDRVYRRVLARYDDTGVMPRLHLLGVSQRWVLNRYPVYSSDSTSWVKPLRFGGGERAGLPGKLPKYGAGEAAYDATLHALRAEIRRHRQIERDATALWADRGITFDD